MTVIERYECPNGHDVPARVAWLCPEKGCDAAVTFEPMARGVALAEQLQGAVEAHDAMLKVMREAVKLDPVGCRRALGAYLSGGSPKRPLGGSR